MNITFTAATLADLTKQIRDFLGDAPPVAATANVTSVGISKAIPGWAPPGSSWLAMPGAPVLMGPDGAAISIMWEGDRPVPAAPVHNQDADAEAAGAALLASIRGTQ